MGSIRSIDKATEDIVKLVLPFTDPEEDASGVSLSESILAPKPEPVDEIVSWNHATRPVVTAKRYQ